MSLIQNPESRNSVSLDGQWNIIPDPYENGYYNHRYQTHEKGYFKNNKAKNPSDLVEYDFSRSQKLNVPGNWNSQEDKLLFYEGTVWYHKDFNLNKKSNRRYVIYFGAINYSAICTATKWVSTKAVLLPFSSILPGNFGMAKILL